MKYTLPIPKKVKRTGKDNIPQIVEEDDLRWMRRVRLPANSELINSLSVNDKATIILVGKIVGLEMREREDQSPRGEIEINVDSIETQGSSDNVFTQMANDIEKESDSE